MERESEKIYKWIERENKRERENKEESKILLEQFLNKIRQTFWYGWVGVCLKRCKTATISHFFSLFIALLKKHYPGIDSRLWKLGQVKTLFPISFFEIFFLNYANLFVIFGADFYIM